MTLIQIVQLDLGEADCSWQGALWALAKREARALQKRLAPVQQCLTDHAHTSAEPTTKVLSATPPKKLLASAIGWTFARTGVVRLRHLVAALRRVFVVSLDTGPSWREPLFGSSTSFDQASQAPKRLRCAARQHEDCRPAVPYSWARIRRPLG
jgi:hypothetical protein